MDGSMKITETATERRINMDELDQSFTELGNDSDHLSIVLTNSC
jgi:hypothetical protein